VFPPQFGHQQALNEHAHVRVIKYAGYNTDPYLLTDCCDVANYLGNEFTIFKKVKNVTNEYNVK
jgi:hypothetical protein